MQNTDDAVVVTIVEEGNEYFLILGKGDHTCDRWRLSKSILYKLALEAITHAFSSIKHH